MVQVKDLKDQIGTATSGRLFLYCLECGEEYSANKGDYFMAEPDHVFQCCGQDMILATKRTVITALADFC